MKKLFGLDLFTFKVKKEPVPMYDFAQHGLLEPNYYGLEQTNWTSTSVTMQVDGSVKAEPAKKEEKKKVSPKELHKMQSLNDNNFAIKATEEYINEQVQQLKDKLS